MRRTRYRQFPRSPFASTELGRPTHHRERFDIIAVSLDGKATRLHGGIGPEAEARLLFAAAIRQAREAPGPAFAVALERVTVSTVAILEPCALAPVEIDRPPHAERSKPMGVAAEQFRAMAETISGPRYDLVTFPHGEPMFGAIRRTPSLGADTPGGVVFVRRLSPPARAWAALAALLTRLQRKS